MITLSLWEERSKTPIVMSVLWLSLDWKDLESVFVYSSEEERFWAGHTGNCFSFWHNCSVAYRRLEVWCLLFFVTVTQKCRWLGFSLCIQSKVPTGRTRKAKLRTATSENWNHLGRQSLIFLLGWFTSWTF